MEIRQGHRPHRIYQPTLTQVRDDTPALLLNRPPRHPQTIDDMFAVHYQGEMYWREADGRYEKIKQYTISGVWA